jgi:hypothetical protein
MLSWIYTILTSFLLLRSSHLVILILILLSYWSNPPVNISSSKMVRDVFKRSTCWLTNEKSTSKEKASHIATAEKTAAEGRLATAPCQHCTADRNLCCRRVYKTNKHDLLICHYDHDFKIIATSSQLSWKRSDLAQIFILFSCLKSNMFTRLTAEECGTWKADRANDEGRMRTLEDFLFLFFLQPVTPWHKVTSFTISLNEHDLQ